MITRTDPNDPFGGSQNDTPDTTVDPNAYELDKSGRAQAILTAENDPEGIIARVRAINQAIREHATANFGFTGMVEPSGQLSTSDAAAISASASNLGLAGPNALNRIMGKTVVPYGMALEMPVLTATSTINWQDMVDSFDNEQEFIQAAIRAYRVSRSTQ